MRGPAVQTSPTRSQPFTRVLWLRDAVLKCSGGPSWLKDACNELHMVERNFHMKVVFSMEANAAGKLGKYLHAYIVYMYIYDSSMYFELLERHKVYLCPFQVCSCSVDALALNGHTLLPVLI